MRRKLLGICKDDKEVGALEFISVDPVNEDNIIAPLSWDGPEEESEKPAIKLVVTSGVLFLRHILEPIRDCNCIELSLLLKYQFANMELLCLLRRTISREGIYLATKWLIWTPGIPIRSIVLHTVTHPLSKDGIEKYKSSRIWGDFSWFDILF